jgi:amidase
MKDNEIWTWDAAATAAAIRAREISSKEAVEATFRRLHSVNPSINAVVEILEDEAVAAAELADDAMASGKVVGPLHGVPITTKINVDIAGHATTNGLVAMKDAMASEDSAPVSNLRRAGAIITGRTNVPAFCQRWFTGNDLHGLTRNPWNPTLTPGGSSGGAGAATAAGIGTIAHGNDLAGSIRLPASACGVYGLKPTVGRTATYNPAQQVEMPLCLQIGVAEGVLARSVRDLRLGLNALEAYDYRDPLQVPAPAVGNDQRMPCRVALFTGETEGWTAPDVAATTRKAASWLADAGYVVEEAVPPHFAEMADLWMTMLYAETAGPVREFMLSLGGDDFRRATLNTAAVFPSMGAVELNQSWSRRLAILREWMIFMKTYPLILTPTSFQPTFPVDHDVVGKEEVAIITKAFRPLNAVAGLGLPGLSVPAGFASGAPAGVQLIAGRFMEERCLAAATVMEERIGALRPIEPKTI